VDEKTKTRFFAKVNKEGPIPAHCPELGACWVWTAARFRSGYGEFRLGGRIQLAHRVAWLIEHDEWPPGNALHKCDNRQCVRLGHIFEGSFADNYNDMVAKNRDCSLLVRSLPNRGALNSQTHLTDDDVRDIRKRRAAGELLRTIAACYRISIQTVSDIHHRKMWKYLD
jgi:HNH endonuclease